MALTRVLCAKRWGIAPKFTPAEPDLEAMLQRADAALVIGDPAFEIDPAKHGVTKIDLGAEWKALTGLPFVYAMWIGRPGAASRGAVPRAAGRRATAASRTSRQIAKQVSGGDAALEQRALAYLRDNLKYGLGDAEQAGLAAVPRTGRRNRPRAVSLEAACSVLLRRPWI